MMDTQILQFNCGLAGRSGLHPAQWVGGGPSPCQRYPVARPSRHGRAESRKRSGAKRPVGKQLPHGKHHGCSSPLTFMKGYPSMRSQLFLLHTEVIDLRAWLASINVSCVLRRCTCGWPSQTVRHILMFYLDHSESQTHFFQHTGAADLQSIQSTKASAHQAAQWLSASGLLTQFNLAQEISQENTAGYSNLQHLNE